MSDPSPPDAHNLTRTEDRRGFLARASTWAMAGGLVAGYGACFAKGAQFLYPAERTPTGWRYVLAIDNMAVGESTQFRAPSGQTIVIARQAEAGTADDFIALSDVCPHLGCRVHWQVQHDRFFCPCHNGVFTPDGVGVSGPPGDAGLNLARFPLEVRSGLLFIEVPLAGPEGRA